MELWMAVLFFALSVFLLGWHLYQRKIWQEDRQSLTGKIDVACDEVLMSLPLAVTVIDAKGNVVWHNELFNRMVGKEKVLKGKINQYLPELALKKHAWFPKWKTYQISLKEKIYHVESKQIRAEQENPRLILFFHDVTEQINLDQRYQDDRPILCFIQVDNFSEAVQGVEEEKRPALLAEIDRLLTEWAGKTEGYLRKFAEDKYFMVLDLGALKENQKSRFEVLDRMREINLGNKIPVTLSIGIGTGDETVADLSRLALAGLDLALTRGGDQVVIKWPDKVLFYGGKSNAPEKKTKVRVRAVANTIRHHLQQASNIIVMGHAGSDLDSAGAALGLARAAMEYNKQVFVVLENSGALDKLYEALREFPEYARIVLTGPDALQYITADSLLIVCDTHKPSLVAEPKLLTKTEKIIIIDHHRRGEEFIEPTLLVYIEPFASSTSEMVAEILQYLGEEISLDALVSAALLAGIMVDTKNFTFQTGQRTFDVASFLRKTGDNPMVRRFLQLDFETVSRRADIIKHAELLHGHFALGVLAEVVPHATIIASQAADILLTIENVTAAFVLYVTPDGINISARSNGEINVQVLMEQLGGGGHFTVAGVQLKDTTLEEAIGQVKNVLEGYMAEQDTNRE